MRLPSTPYFGARKDTPSSGTNAGAAPGIQRSLTERGAALGRSVTEKVWTPAPESASQSWPIVRAAKAIGRNPRTSLVTLLSLTGLGSLIIAPSVESSIKRNAVPTINEIKELVSNSGAPQAVIDGITEPQAFLQSYWGTRNARQAYTNINSWHAGSTIVGRNGDLGNMHLTYEGNYNPKTLEVQVPALGLQSKMVPPANSSDPTERLRFLTGRASAQLENARHLNATGFDDDAQLAAYRTARHTDKDGNLLVTDKAIPAGGPKGIPKGTPYVDIYDSKSNMLQARIFRLDGQRPTKDNIAALALQDAPDSETAAGCKS